MCVGVANDNLHSESRRTGSGCAGVEEETRTDATIAARVPLFRRLNGLVVLLPKAFVTIQELQQVFDPRGGVWIERKYVPSMPPGQRTLMRQ